MDIVKLIKSVFRHYKIIIASSLLVALLVFLFTFNIPRKYQSTATIYTGIGTGTTPTSTEGRMDYLTLSSSFDNLLSIITSRETMKEVGLRLLVMHLTLKDADPAVISPEHLESVREKFPPDIRGLVGETDSITYQNLMAEADSNPFLIGILNYPVPYYSYQALSSISVNRMRTSDMISLSYSCDDQGVCQKTLEILIDVCIRNYRKIKEGQVDKVVGYYEEQVKSAQQKLKRSEAREQNFKEVYGLVDFNTQTGMVIAGRQEIITQIQKEQEIMSATEAGIRNIENQLGSQSQSLRNSGIMEKKDRLSRLSYQLNAAELNRVSADRIAELQTQIDQVKSELSQDIAASSTAITTGRTSEIAATEYFNKVITFEESKARLRALENRRDAALGQFNRYLPLGDTLKRIQREIDINEKEYLTALSYLNESKKQQQDQRSFSTVQVIDKPNYPLTAKSMRKTLVMIGGFLGFIIPTLIFLGLAYFNSNIQTPARAEQATGLRVGGIVPDTKLLQGQKNAEVISDGLSDTILKNLYLADHKNKQQRILIVSTRPSEGKTIISNMLCERLLRKGRKCLVVIPYLDSGSWSVVSYKVDNAFYQARAEDLVPVERLNSADILILELPSLIMSDYPVALIKEFDMAFLVCDANREWTKADQTALDSFIKISEITPQLILNNVELDVVEEILGKIK